MPEGKISLEVKDAAATGNKRKRDPDNPPDSSESTGRADSTLEPPVNQQPPDTSLGNGSPADSAAGPAAAVPRTMPEADPAPAVATPTSEKTAMSPRNQGMWQAGLYIAEAAEWLSRAHVGRISHLRM